MDDRNRAIKDAIIDAALPNIVFDGWTDTALSRAAEECGYSKNMARAVFANGVSDALSHFSDLADRRMLESIDTAFGTSFDGLKVREKITECVWARFQVLAPFKDAERQAVAYWSGLFRKKQGAKIVWKTADVIWVRAGDVSDDYNRYTKRALLSAVLVSTMLFWLSDTSKDHADSRAFLDRRIDNVLSIGKIARRFKKS